MAEILGMGLSHYPGPLVPVDKWPRALTRNVHLGRIPREVFEDKTKWPKEMRDEWGNDEGLSAAKAHSERLMAGFKRLRSELDAFDPDFILIYGDDQFENFRRQCVPAFCVYIFDEVNCRPYGGASRPYETPENAWGVPADTLLKIKGHREGASALTQSLIEQGIDAAYAYETSSPVGLAHSFNNTVVFLDHDRLGFPWPIVPFHVNCYGAELQTTAANVFGQSMKELSPPAPTPKRCFEVGRATARFLAESPWRVCVIASSSWSHSHLTPKHDRLYPDLPADRARFAELQDGSFRKWDEMTPEEIGDAGQGEILNWICLAGAMTETGQEFEAVDFVETHVYNSSKCFGYFPPNGAG